MCVELARPLAVCPTSRWTAARLAVPLEAPLGGPERLHCAGRSQAEGCAGAPSSPRDPLWRLSSHVKGRRFWAWASAELNM